MAFEVPGSIWHSEEAHTLWGGPDPLLALAQRRMSLSMSRAGTPTDNGYAERVVSVFKLAGASRRPYDKLGEIFCERLRRGINF